MKIQLGARTRFRRKSDQVQIGETKGFAVDLETADLVMDAPWTQHTHYWVPKEGFTGVLEAGARRRSQDPAGAGQIGGRVRFRRDSDGEWVGNEIAFAELVTLAELQQEDTVVRTETWDATAQIEGQLQVGVRLPPEEQE
jgi:hypothetical protein